MLHTVSHTETYLDTVSFMALLKPNDVVLLWQDGVVIGIDNTPLLTVLREQYISVFALHSDVVARGLNDIYDSYITQIDLNQCVKLTEHHYPQLAW